VKVLASKGLCSMKLVMSFNSKEVDSVRVSEKQNNGLQSATHVQIVEHGFFLFNLPRRLY
jgi:hypothetical protein